MNSKIKAVKKNLLIGKMSVHAYMLFNWFLTSSVIFTNHNKCEIKDSKDFLKKTEKTKQFPTMMI